MSYLHNRLEFQTSNHKTKNFQRNLEKSKYHTQSFQHQRNFHQKLENEKKTPIPHGPNYDPRGVPGSEHTWKTTTGTQTRNIGFLRNQAGWGRIPHPRPGAGGSLSTGTRAA